MAPDWISSLFAPQSVALIGAGDDPNRAGGRLVKYMTGNGYGGRVYCVNPGRTMVQGLPCYPAISAVPEKVDLALVAVNAGLAPDVVMEVGRAGVPAAVVFASGFAEVGGRGVALQRRLAAAVKETGVRVLGPNTAGVRATHIGLFGEQGTNLGTVGFRSGSVAMVSQSGALGGYFGSTYLKRMGVGTRYFVDTGNEVDIDAADCVEYISRDDSVSCIALILEATIDGHKLADMVRTAVARSRPVLVLKVGRSEAGMRAASSHTAAMSSQVELFEAELAAAGAFVTRDEVQLCDAILLHATGCVPAGNRVGVITPSGGFGVLALDLADEVGLSLPEIALPSPELLGDVGLGGSSNPLEVAALAGSGTTLLEAALEHVRTQPNIDSVILWHPHRLLDEEEGEGNATALINSRAASGKPHFHCGMQRPEIERRLVDAGVAAFQSPRRLFSALAAVGRGEREPEAPRPRSDEARTSPMTPAEVRALLAKIGVTSVATRPVASAAEAIDAGEAWGAPIFLKLESRHASHKTEGGLVKGPLAGSSIRTAFDDLTRTEVAARDGEASIVAQPLVTGIELALGGYIDPVFGPAVMVAHGGVFVEVFRDAAFAAAPVDIGRAMYMIRRLRIYPALAGARGRPADIAAVAEAVVALSKYMQTVADGAFSIDINPLIVGKDGEGAFSVDARVAGVPTVMGPGGDG